MRSHHRKPALAVALAGTLLLAACSAPATDTGGGDDAPAATDASEVPETPSEPVELNILDVAGNLKLTQGMIESFVEENPDVVSSVTFESGGAPDLVGTLKPQVDTGDLSIDLVLSGTDGMSAGISEDLWVPLVDEFGDRLSNMENYLPAAADMQELAEGYGVLNAYTPSGPMLQYNPDAVAESDVPTTPEELLAWAQANPGKFGYPRPANSGVGRTFLQGLPYMLGDSDPKDPENGWDKTWAYLKELGQYVDTYPTGTGQGVTNISDGTWSMWPMTMGWDIEPRADGRAPGDLEVAPFADFTWVSDSQYALMPRGLSADKQSAVLLLIQDMLTPEQNAKAFDNGYFYPGPAVEGATLDLAPQETQDVIAEFGRDWYDEAIESHDIVTPLDADALITAFDTWDREVGTGKVPTS
jgi:putative spermidine/putrescine transport system substrate-binding protein